MSAKIILRGIKEQEQLQKEQEQLELDFAEWPNSGAFLMPTVLLMVLNRGATLKPISSQK